MADEEGAHKQQVDDLKLRLSTTLSFLADLTAKVDALQLQQRSTEARIESQQAAHRLEIDALEANHQREMSSLEQKIANLTSANNQLLWQQQALEKEIAGSSDKIRLLQGEILGARGENARLKKELATANSSVEAASIELAAASKDN